MGWDGAGVLAGRWGSAAEVVQYAVWTTDCLCKEQSFWHGEMQVETSEDSYTRTGAEMKIKWW